jgi:hypothetical protein
MPRIRNNIFETITIPCKEKGCLDVVLPSRIITGIEELPCAPIKLRRELGDLRAGYPKDMSSSEKDTVEQ